MNSFSRLQEDYVRTRFRMNRTKFFFLEDAQLHVDLIKTQNLSTEIRVLRSSLIYFSRDRKFPHEIIKKKKTKNADDKHHHVIAQMSDTRSSSEHIKTLFMMISAISRGPIAVIARRELCDLSIFVLIANFRIFPSSIRVLLSSNLLAHFTPVTAFAAFRCRHIQYQHKSAQSDNHAISTSKSNFNIFFERISLCIADFV